MEIRNSPCTRSARGHETYPIVIGRKVSDASIDISVPRMIYRHANPPLNHRLNGNVALHHVANMDAIRPYRWRRCVPGELQPKQLNGECGPKRGVPSVLLLRLGVQFGPPKGKEKLGPCREPFTSDSHRVARFYDSTCQNKMK